MVAQTVSVEVDVTTPIPPKRAVTSKMAPWVTLDQLLVKLRNLDQALPLIEASLQTIVETMPVEAAFYLAGDTICSVGRDDLSLLWCQSFLRVAFQDGMNWKEETLWQRPLKQIDLQPLPLHAAIIQVGNATTGWLGMLRFATDVPFINSDLGFLHFTQRLLVNQQYQAQTRVRFRESLVGMLRGLTEVIEAKDSYTSGHSERVARIAVVLGEHMHLDATAVHNLFLAGLMHDIGKVGVPDRILLKDGPLTAREFDVMRSHPVIGDQIIAQIKSFSRLRAGIRHHHERWDGQGYPDALAGTNIPLPARILAVADTCDALMSQRRYRPSRTPPEIDATLSAVAGSQLDPEVLAHFMDCRNQIYPPIFQKGIGDSASHAVDGLLAGSHYELRVE